MPDIEDRPGAADPSTAGESIVAVEPSGRAVTVRPPTRRPVDAALLVAGAVVLGITWQLAADGVSPAEASLFHAINSLPAAIYPVVAGPMQLGSLAAVPVAAVLAVLARRYWMATALGAAGLTAYVLARGVKIAVDRGRPLDELSDVVVHGARALGDGFPSGHSAVSAALVLAALPYLVWRWRHALLALPLLVTFARVYVGAHLPLDVVGGLAVGVIAASAVHLAIGRPTMSAEDLPPEPAPEAPPEPAPEVPPEPAREASATDGRGRARREGRTRSDRS